MSTYRVFYTIAGRDGTDDVLAHSSTEAMELVEELLLAWGYPNACVQVDFAQEVL